MSGKLPSRAEMMNFSAPVNVPGRAPPQPRPDMQAVTAQLRGMGHMQRAPMNPAASRIPQAPLAPDMAPGSITKPMPMNMPGPNMATPPQQPVSKSGHAMMPNVPPPPPAAATPQKLPPRSSGIQSGPNVPPPSQAAAAQPQVSKSGMPMMPVVPPPPAAAEPKASKSGPPMMPNLPPPSQAKRPIAPAMPNLPPPPANKPPAARKGPVVEAPEEDIKFDESDICPFYQEGECTYGDSCWYIHADPSQLKPEKDHKCGICLNKIRASGKQYGLLQTCPHTFCLQCIREWRGRTDIPKDVARGCPICRLNTYVIIPSDVYLATTEEKDQIQATYKSNLGDIPCKHFNFGEGTCPFGTSCFYEHKYKNGETWVPPPPNFVMDKDGEWQIPQKKQLCDMILMPNKRRI